MMTERLKPTPNEFDIPNSETVIANVQRVENIQWFEPPKPPEKEIFQPLINQYFSRLDIEKPLQVETTTDFSTALAIISVQKCHQWINKADSAIKHAGSDHYEALYALNDAILGYVNQQLAQAVLLHYDVDITENPSILDRFSSLLPQFSHFSTLNASLKLANAISKEGLAAVEHAYAASAASYPYSKDAEDIYLLHEIEDEKEKARIQATKKANEALLKLVERISETNQPIPQKKSDKEKLNCKYISWHLAKAVDWELVAGLIPHYGYTKGNPFEPLLTIAEMGCLPLGITPDNRFGVFIPSINATA